MYGNVTVGPLFFIHWVFLLGGGLFPFVTNSKESSVSVAAVTERCFYVLNLIGSINRISNNGIGM